MPLGRRERVRCKDSQGTGSAWFTVLEYPQLPQVCSLAPNSPQLPYPKPHLTLVSLHCSLSSCFLILYAHSLIYITFLEGKSVLFANFWYRRAKLWEHTYLCLGFIKCFSSTEIILMVKVKMFLLPILWGQSKRIRIWAKRKGYGERGNELSTVGIVKHWKCCLREVWILLYRDLYFSLRYPYLGPNNLS